MDEDTARLQQRLERDLRYVRVGAWYTRCCHLDLGEIRDEEEAASIRADIEWALEDIAAGDTTDSDDVYVWPTRQAALEEMRTSYSDDSESAREIDAMMGVG